MARIVTLTLLLPTLAWSQDRTLLYVNPAPLVTASRLMALGGAAVGLAENSESLPFNYASVAQRHPRRTRGFDWDLTASVLFSPVATLRDTDNEGVSPDTNAPVESQIGGLVQFKRFGVGAYFRGQRKSVCTVSPCITSTTTAGSVVFGFNAIRDQLVFGVGLNLASANFTVEGKTYDYLGINVAGGMLWRPSFWPFRIGVHGVSETRGNPGFDPMMVAPIVPGRTVFTGVVSPARLSIGGSMRFGEGSWRYNRLSASALKELPDDYNFANVPHDLDPEDPRPPGRFLATIALDIILPVKGATNLTPLLLGTPASAVGEEWYFVPRLGFEAEAIDHRLRLRAGGYLESPFLKGASSRPHVTGGFEVFLFSLFADWSISASMDYAERYLSMSFGVGWWT